MRHRGQEDFGWYLEFRIAHEAFVLIVGYRPGDGDKAGEWIGEIQRASGLLDFVFRRLRDVLAHVAETVDQVIRALPGVSAVWWHHATVFDSDEGQGAPSPAG